MKSNSKNILWLLIFGFLLLNTSNKLFSTTIIHPLINSKVAYSGLQNKILFKTNEQQATPQKKTSSKVSKKEEVLPALDAAKLKKLALFRRLINKNKQTLSQILVFYIVNQFLLTYVLKSEDKSVYSFLKRSYVDINNFLTTQADFLDITDKYLVNTELSTSFKYLPLILKLHSGDEKKDKIGPAKIQEKKDKPYGLWQITPKFLDEISSGNGGKISKEDLSDPKATIFMARYFRDRYEALNRNTFYVIVEFLTRDNEKNILQDLLKEAKATSINDIEEYLDVRDRMKIREFLAIYFYDKITTNPNLDFYKDRLVVDVLKKNPIF